MEQEKTAQFIKMTETPIPKLVSSLALPTVVSMLVSAIYNMADTFFVSHLGTDASAAVGIVFSVQSVIQAAGFGIGMGAGSLISRHLGMCDKRSADKFASSAFFCSVLFGLILLLIGVFDINNMMNLFGADKSTLPYARDYGFYILLGAPIMCSSCVMNNILRSEGRAKLAMIGLASGGVLNIILDPLFIFDSGLGLGTKGAALATVASQIISFLILISLFIFGKSEVKLSISAISRRISDYILIIKTGLPTVCRQGLAALATMFLNRQARVYGSAVVAAVTIATKLYMFVRNAVIGIGQGFQPVAGYNYGAKRNDRVKGAFNFATALGTAVVLCATVVFLIFAPQIMAMFRDDTRVIETGARGLRFLCMSLPLMAYSTYVNQLFQSLGKVKRATFLAACRNGICYIPLVFILPMLFKVDGILLTQPLADILTFIISVPLHIMFFKELGENSAESAEMEKPSADIQK